VASAGERSDPLPARSRINLSCRDIAVAHFSGSALVVQLLACRPSAMASFRPAFLALEIDAGKAQNPIGHGFAPSTPFASLAISVARQHQLCDRYALGSWR